MTSKERVCAALRREPVDYVPCSPFMNPQDSIQRTGKRWQFPCGPSQAEMIHYFAGELGLDMAVSVGWASSFPGPGVSSRVWMEGDSLHKTWTTPAGDLHAAIRHDDHWPHGYDIPLYSDNSIGRYLEPWVQNRDDVECLRHILVPPKTDDQISYLRFQHAAAKRLADTFELPLVVSIGMGLTGAHHLFDTTRLCMLALDDPDLVDAYLEVEHRLNLANIDLALDMGVDIVRRNGFYETCDFFSPDFLRKMLGNRINAEARLVHQAGGIIGYTVLTGYTPMLDHLADLDLDCLVVPDPFFEGSDPVALRDRLSDRMSFWTGPSDTLHMPWDDQDAVRQAVRSTFEIFGKTGLILTACSSTKAPHPWANTLAMVDEWKKLR